MGRGRGKGRKPAVVSHEEHVNAGEEVLVAYKRRGRPQKPMKDDLDDDKIEKIEEAEEGDEVKTSEGVKSHQLEKGKKRKKKNSQVNENSDSNLVDNDTSVKSSIEESTRANGFRQNGSRRKGKPRRAAEAGVECE